MPKLIRVKENTYFQLRKLKKRFRKARSLDDVIQRLIKFYLELELR